MAFKNTFETKKPGKYRAFVSYWNKKLSNLQLFQV